MPLIRTPWRATKMNIDEINSVAMEANFGQNLTFVFKSPCPARVKSSSHVVNFSQVGPVCK